MSIVFWKRRNVYYTALYLKTDYGNFEAALLWLKSSYSLYGLLGYLPEINSFKDVIRPGIP
jgi:hypothetical protein